MLCTLALGAAACGGPEPADERTTREVTETIRTYYDAFARGEGRRLCATLVEEAREGVDADGKGCVQAAELTAQAVPQELRDELRKLSVTDVQVDGGEATAKLRLDSEYAAKPRSITVKLQREDDAWRLSELPDDDESEPDPVTTCFASGMKAFDDDQADPFWKREGRRDFAYYLGETCRRAVDRRIVREGAGELTPAQREKFQAVAGEVLREMIADDRVREP